ncbi:TrmH family RNA methyltransferase [Kitasatospora purpeofusca]|uniref:TrmH family RNA methyltransferase n=1 Tax=Kitasatospora purpeofusca TaxID=67352 RepID=UPI002A5A07FF|nr:TrmH family RNA methyltransferase [Kitasatospora purpeofusca]MDY0812183.1 TrmH family RNA methyltransferase [Kitasatospora purpeofusca]
MKQLRGTELKRLHRSWRRGNEFRLAMILENLQSPFNVGSVVRTGAAMGAEKLYLTGDTPSVRSSGAQKAAMGTDKYLKVEHFPTVAEAVAAAKADGFKVVGLELADEAVPLFAAGLTPAVAFVLGHEDRGITADALALCDQVVFVPQLGRVGSLNVSAAATVACYEARRQGFALSGTPDGSDAGGFDIDLDLDDE